MGKMSKDVKYVFVEYDGPMPPCCRCVFADGSEDVCDRKKCRGYEREDGKDGYFRAANVTKLSYPYPKGGTQ